MSDLRGFAVSVPGNGHIRRELPCQDASGVWLAPRPCLIVCDGRGSARFSHFGARAAVKAFRSQCAVMDDLLAAVLDRDKRSDHRWLRFCDLMIRTVCQQKRELAEEYGCDEAEFDFTIAFAVGGRERWGFFQVGDGAIVIRSGTERPGTVFPPDKGEYDNETRFLRPEAEFDRSYHARLIAAEDINAVAVTSDGPEFLMFDLADTTPGPIFARMFDDCAAGELTRQDLLDYLTRSCWGRDPRGGDDRSIAILSKTSSPGECEQDKAEQDF